MDIKLSLGAFIKKNYTTGNERDLIAGSRRRLP
jgi:hypothetical protein